MAATAKTHGMSATQTYRAWQNMRARCECQSNPGYPDYGARGIRVCERWSRSFEAFLADMGEKPEGHSLDRINNNSDYEPSNCRWASRTTQQRNRRTCRMLTINGEARALSEWCEIYGQKHPAVILRLKRGLSPLEALTLPLHAGKRNDLCKD
jgi:hypothetical protein